jgi:hypothetical protein
MNGEEANGSGGAPNLFESGVPIFISPYKLALLLLVKEFVLLSASAEDGELVRDEEQMAIFGHTRPQLASFLIAEVKALATDREKTLAQFIEAMSAYELDEIVDGLREQVRLPTCQGTHPSHLPLWLCSLGGYANRRMRCTNSSDGSLRCTRPHCRAFLTLCAPSFSWRSSAHALC